MNNFEEKLANSLNYLEDSRVKEAMFSVINFRLQNAVTLDLFA